MHYQDMEQCEEHLKEYPQCEGYEHEPNKSDGIIRMQDIIGGAVDVRVGGQVWRSDALNRGSIVSMPSTSRSAKLQGLQAMAFGKRKKAKDGK